MANPSFNDIPYEIMINFILPLISVKEVGALAMVSPVWRDICNEQEVWKELYRRTIRSKISDSSEHIGPRWSRHGYYANRRERQALFGDGTSWRDIAHLSSHWNCRSDTILRIQCIPKELGDTLMPWSHIRQDGGTSDQFRPSLQPNLFSLACEIHKANVDLYLDYIENEWLAYNESKGLSTYNLCQCADHYKFETLEMPSKCRNYKEFKKITLKKLMTQSKHASKKNFSALQKKKKEYEKFRAHTERLEREFHKTLHESERCDSLCDKLAVAINPNSGEC